MTNKVKGPWIPMDAKAKALKARRARRGNWLGPILFAAIFILLLVALTLIDDGEAQGSIHSSRGVHKTPPPSGSFFLTRTQGTGFGGAGK